MSHLCECGCGGVTRIAPCSDRSKGWVRGQSLRFIRGHQGRQPFSDRFAAFVDRTDSCWLWMGYRDKDGYGTFQVNDRPERAHRLAWSIAHDCEIPDGMSVCHACDTPACVNPTHLFIGSQGDNMRDMVAKHRHPGGTARGSRHPLAKLNERAVRHIRQAAESGAGIRALARLHGVSHPAIRAVVGRKTWKHV